MSLLLTWLAIATATSVVFVVFVALRSRPRTRPAHSREPVNAGYLVQLGPPKCRCGICTGKVRLPLSPQEVANVQASVLAVVGGVTRVVAGAADYMTDSGVGRVAIVVCDDALFAQAVEPAIRQCLAVPRSA